MQVLIIVRDALVTVLLKVAATVRAIDQRYVFAESAIVICIIGTIIILMTGLSHCVQAAAAQVLVEVVVQMVGPRVSRSVVVIE